MNKSVIEPMEFDWNPETAVSEERSSAIEQPRDIAIIGGGIASALLADALMRRNARITLYSRDSQPAEGASGNRQGAIYPLIIHGNSIVSDFFVSAFWFARQHYAQLTARGIVFDQDWCGVCQLAYDDKSARKIQTLLEGGWPETLFSAADSRAMTDLCGLTIDCSGIHYPAGGWLSPQQLTTTLLAELGQQGLQACWQHELVALTPQKSGWQLQFQQGQIASHSLVILANGHRLPSLVQTANLPLSAVRGQLSYVPVTADLQHLRKILCYNGYLLPANPQDGLLSLGASHTRQRLDTGYSDAEQQQNHQRLSCALAASPWIKQIDTSGKLSSCGIRSSTRDHLPLVGAVPDFTANLSADKKQVALHHPNLFMLGGLGSRGLCSGPLLAELLSAQIYGEPLPLSQRLVSALVPERFWRKK